MTEVKSWGHLWVQKNRVGGTDEDANTKDHLRTWLKSSSRQLTLRTVCSLFRALNIALVWTTKCMLVYCNNLPESPYPGLSLSYVTATAAAVRFVLGEGVVHENDDVDDGDGGGGVFFYVHSAITTPELDGRWDENVLAHKHVSYLSYTLRERGGQREVEWVSLKRGTWWIAGVLVMHTYTHARTRTHTHTRSHRTVFFLSDLDQVKI